ncbi:hypothetical protein [Enterococcus hulanensis]|uniref:hypothetical protein n=1 Tax=Enterococcus hulanensis TaxID=2559929 RepID=UPI0010F5B577|nr:hypothetical protein [Enterococcus hulanensis]
MSGVLVVVDFGEDAEDLNDSYLADSPKQAVDRCLRECKRIMDELLAAGFRCKLHVREDQMIVENVDDHSKINFFFQPLFGQKKEPVLFGEEQAVL